MKNDILEINCITLSDENFTGISSTPMFENFQIEEEGLYAETYLIGSNINLDMIRSR